MAINKKSSTSGLRVTTDSSGKIVSASDSKGTYSVKDGIAVGSKGADKNYSAQNQATMDSIRKSSSGGGTTSKTSSPSPVSPATPATTGSPLGGIVGSPLGGIAGGPVVTSDKARDAYSMIKDRIAKMADSTLDYSSYLGDNNPMSALIGQQRESLAQRRKQEVARINSEYTQAQAGQQQKQSSETGTQSMSLARMGGFDSASGQAVLTNLQRVHEGEQNALMQARQSALLQAQQAYEDKDFALAKMQIDEAKAAEALMYNRQQDFIRNSLAIRGEERADAQMQLQYAQFEYGKKRDQLQDQRQAIDFALKHNIGTGFYFVGGIGYDTSTGEALSYDEYVKRGGDPNFKNNVTTIEPGSELERQFVIDLANKYPDAPIDIMNDDAATARSRINGSRIYQEQVRPPSSGGGNTKESRISQLLVTAKSNLDTQRAESSDGYANPDTYRDNKTAYVSAGGTPSDFFQMFPPEVYITPKNRKGDLDVYKSSQLTPEQQLIEDFRQQYINSTPVTPGQ